MFFRKSSPVTEEPLFHEQDRTEAIEYIQQGMEKMALVPVRNSQEAHALNNYLIRIDNIIEIDPDQAPLIANNMHTFLKKKPIQNTAEYLYDILPGTIGRGVGFSILFLLMLSYIPIIIILCGPVHDVFDNKELKESIFALSFLNRLLSEIMEYDYAKELNMDFVEKWVIAVCIAMPLCGFYTGLTQTMRKQHQSELSKQILELVDSCPDETMNSNEENDQETAPRQSPRRQ